MVTNLNTKRPKQKYGKLHVKKRTKPGIGTAVGLMLTLTAKEVLKVGG